MNNFQDNRNRVAVSLNNSTNNQLYSTNLIALRHVNNPGNSALNNTKRSKEKKVGVFPIRYIAVLGFQRVRGNDDLLCVIRFNPLYRGTWFPTSDLPLYGKCVTLVSIRYIAVLGFQPYLKNTPSDQRRRKRFTHPPSNRSHSHICFLKSR